jgi:crotonobetainyl-CoA:carnitine CoA-transferase CaiB-like acyl-CoA transferase
LHALYERMHHGEAVELDTSLYEAAIFTLSELVRLPDGRFAGGEPLDADQAGFHPAERVYQAQDGWIAVAARSDEMAAAFARAIGVPDPGPRACWGRTTATVLARRIRERHCHHWLDALSSAGVWVVECSREGWDAIRQDPAARRAGFVIDVDDAKYGTVTCVGSLVTFSRTGLPAERMVMAKLGQHTREVLAEIGTLTPEMDALVAGKAVA